MAKRSILKCLCLPTAIIVIVAVAGFVFVVLPLRGQIASESDRIQMLHSKIEHAGRKVARLPEIEAQFGVVKEDERKISRLLPESRAVDFIEEVEEIARAVGGEVVITQGTIAEAAKKKRPVKDAESASQEKPSVSKTITEDLPWEKRLPLRVTFSGEYTKAVNFLHKVETMAYRLDVVSIDIRPVAPEENRRSSENLFVSTPLEGAEVPVPIEPEPEKPLVSASFDLVVYME